MRHKEVRPAGFRDVRGVLADVVSVGSGTGICEGVSLKGRVRSMSEDRNAPSSCVLSVNPTRFVNIHLPDQDAKSFSIGQMHQQWPNNKPQALTVTDFLVVYTESS